MSAPAEKARSPRARHDDRPHVVVVRRSREHLEQLAAHGLVLRVVHVGPVQGDGDDVVGLLVADGLVLGGRWADALS